ncbi:unnamed protein product [Rodentolepis nana]|uniref:Uncharacterized protein n=1 Tax=Rodentolepis nana TaxID=102285 RepID=A0A0R3T854_RODNA|nr:unnamed protein product [Rodentolepis nana]
MCVFCLESECKADCVQKFDERLNSMYERLLSSFASTKQVIDVEVMKQSRMLCSRRNSLIHKLETQFKQDVQSVQRLIGLLEYAKSRNNSERNGLVAYIESQLNSLLYRQFAELESFEILDSSPTSSRTCSLCVCEKMDKAPAMACKQSENPASVPPGSCHLFPPILKDSNAWLPKPSKSIKLDNAEKKDLDEKLEALAIKQEIEKSVKDIECPRRVRFWKIYHISCLKDFKAF